jgi:hypothetical protein
VYFGHSLRNNSGRGKIDMGPMNRDEFYRRLAAGDVSGDPTGQCRRPFFYHRLPGDRVSEMVLYGAPYIYFTVLEDGDGEYHVAIKFDPGSGKVSKFWIKAADLDELHHDVLERDGERAVRMHVRKSGERYCRSTWH